MSAQFFIRDYTDADEIEVVSIHDLARPIELQGSCDPRAFVPLKDDPEDLEEFLSCKKLVAHDDNRLLGFIGIGEGEVGWLYVRPDESRRGIGRRLLHRVLELIRQKNDSSAETTVFVLEGNLPAIRLYESEGFLPVTSFKSKNNGYPCVVRKMARKSG